jgi:hypothetical protein
LKAIIRTAHLTQEIVKLYLIIPKVTSFKQDADTEVLQAHKLQHIISSNRARQKNVP